MRVLQTERGGRYLVGAFDFGSIEEADRHRSRSKSQQRERPSSRRPATALISFVRKLLYEHERKRR